MAKILFMLLSLTCKVLIISSNSVEEYLVSIKSLRFKKEEIHKEIKTEASKDFQNLLAIKIWLKIKRPSLPNNQVACTPIASIWVDNESYLYNSNPMQLRFSSDHLYYCGSRINEQKQKLSNIYKTNLVFSNKEYTIKKLLGSGRVEKIRIDFSCNKNTFINNFCIGYNEYNINTNDIQSKSFCMDMDVITHCFTSFYSRTNYSELLDYSLVLTNLPDIQRGLELMNRESYSYNIDLICDNVHFELVNSSSECLCNADEWNKQNTSNINVFFVGFEAETKETMIDPVKCTKSAN